MRVLVAGATGVVGRPLVAALQRRGHAVSALVRSDPSKLPPGVEPVTADVFDPGLDEAIRAAAPDVVIHQLTALPARMDPKRLDVALGPTNRLRTEGTRCLLRAAAGRRVIAQSMAIWYRPAPGLATEADPLYTDAPAPMLPMIAAGVELERQVLEHGGVVLRYGSFYGPRTMYAPDGSMAEDARAGRLAQIGPGEGRMSFVHVEDAAEAAAIAVDGGPSGVFNVVDDDPAAAHEWLGELLAAVGRGRPWRVPRWIGRLAAGPYPDYLMNECRGASNAAFKAAFGWVPSRPSWRGALAR